MGGGYGSFELIGRIVAGFFVGGFYGLAPLIVGMLRKKILIGVLCFLSCIALALLLLLVGQVASLTIILAIAETVGIIIFSTKNKKT
jgi:hypothetical protein